jgi:putative OPT family oligopeptide transporter
MQENNIVQTVASAAGTLSAIIFVLPGLVMIGWWTGFPFWVTFGICATGGILGVMYTIPLRRALVTDSDLPYPEGVACAEVLKVGGGDDAVAASAESSKSGLFAVAAGTIVSAVFAVVVATKVFAGSVAQYFHVGDRGGASGYDFSLSFALLAVGHLVGLWVGLAMLLGALIAWGWAVPHYTMLAAATGAAADMAQAAWGTKVRFIGAGTIGVAAIWTLAKLVKPVISGLSSAMASSRARKAGQGDTLPRTEHDMPIGIVGLISLLCLLPIGWLLGDFSVVTGLGSHLWLLVIGGLIFVVIMGFLVSAVCGYMAGLIGSSNSPLSGVGILVVIIAALLLLVAGVKSELLGDAGKGLVAFALFATSVVFAVATIANNNLQDLKTGQLVDATPWKQQVALVVGVLVGAAVIPPVLDLLNEAYGFAGMPGVDPARALAAPQAGLISALAQGVITNNIDWGLIITGIWIGVGVIVVDAILARTTRMRIPPLAVGLGIYLPTASTLMVVVGSVVGWLFDRRADRGPKPEATKQLGVLLASGLIVGESIVGVLVAAVVAVFGGSPLALVPPAFGNIAEVLGGLVFVAVVAVLYRWIARLARRGA